MATNRQQDIGEDVKGVLSLQGDDLDFAIAEKVLGAQWHDVPAAGGTALRFTPAGNSIATSWTGRGPLMPHYSTSLDAIRPIIRKAIEEGLGTLLDRKLAAVRMDMPPEWIWNLEPEDYCRALILAYAAKDANE